MSVLNSDRRFRVWEFRVSHNQLLLRSPRSESRSTNVDVAFAGVEYLDLATDLVGLRLEEGNTADLAAIPALSERPLRGARAFVMTTAAGRRHVVVAASVTVSENDLDLFETSRDILTVTASNAKPRDRQDDRRSITDTELAGCDSAWG